MNKCSIFYPFSNDCDYIPLLLCSDFDSYSEETVKNEQVSTILNDPMTQENINQSSIFISLCSVQYYQKKNWRKSLNPTSLPFHLPLH